MRLLIVTQVVDLRDPNLGFFHRWVEEFSKHVEKVEVLCLREGEHHLPENVRVHSLGKERGGNTILYVLRFYRRLWQLKGEYDAVFVHMNSEYLLLGGFYWKLKHIPVTLWHVHKSMTLIHRIGEKLVDAVVTASPESYRLKSKKVHVLGHGIDTDYFAPEIKPSDSTFRIVTTGRIARVKGLHTLLSAVAGLEKVHTSIEVLLLGTPLTAEDEAYQKELQEHVASLGLSGIVHFIGSVPHTGILSYLQKADVFVNCSFTGSLDKAVLEAMAVGIPIITSNEGLRTALGVHATTLMVEGGNSEALSQKLHMALARSKEERTILGKSLRALVVKEHSLSKLIPKILALYNI